MPFRLRRELAHTCPFFIGSVCLGLLSKTIGGFKL